MVLDDARAIGTIYQRRPHPKVSAEINFMCPRTNQSQIVSIVYLENNLTAGAFTPERVELLKVLSGQAVIPDSKF